MDSGVAKPSLASHPSERWRVTPIQSRDLFISRHEERAERPGIKRASWATLLCKFTSTRCWGETGLERVPAKMDPARVSMISFVINQLTTSQVYLVASCWSVEHASSKASIESFVDGLAEEENDGMIM
jgi:hypothetical protein